MLPACATFVLGILECDQLQPNAARDGLVAGDALSSLRAALGVSLVERLGELGEKDPERPGDVLRWHEYEILGMSLQNGNESFFEAIAPVMPLETMTGQRVTLWGLWEAAGGKPALIRYRTVRPSEPGPSGFASGAGADEIVGASPAFVEEFLRRAARRWPARMRIECVEDGGAEDCLEEFGPAESVVFEPGVAVFREIAGTVAVRLARLENAAVPAVLAFSGAPAECELCRLADDVRVPAGSSPRSPQLRIFAAGRPRIVGERRKWLCQRHQLRSPRTAAPYRRRAAFPYRRPGPIGQSLTRRIAPDFR